MEIIKQMFDVASLFDRIDNLELVRKTFMQIAPIELEYRKKDPTDIQSVLDDVYNTSEIICKSTYKNDGSFEYKELARGVTQIHDLIINENYSYYSAVVNASKSAYLATLLAKGIDVIEKYDPEFDMSKLKLSQKIAPEISKIKSMRPEAFFYWYKIGELLDK